MVKRIARAERSGFNLNRCKFAALMAAKVAIFKTKFKYRPFADHSWMAPSAGELKK